MNFHEQLTKHKEALQSLLMAVNVDSTSILLAMPDRSGAGREVCYKAYTKLRELSETLTKALEDVSLG